jgi:hypothetical protein
VNTWMPSRRPAVRWAMTFAIVNRRDHHHERSRPAAATSPLWCGHRRRRLEGSACR